MWLLLECGPYWSHNSIQNLYKGLHFNVCVLTLLTFYLSGAVLYEHFREKLSWADTDYEVLDSFQALKLLTIWSKKPLLWSCKQTFAAVCLFPLEFLLWKIFLTFFIISNETKLKKCNLKLSLIYLCIMLENLKHVRHNTIDIFKKILEPFMASWS